jgi:hypothetical protein
MKYAPGYDPTKRPQPDYRMELIETLADLADYQIAAGCYEEAQATLARLRRVAN